MRYTFMIGCTLIPSIIAIVALKLNNKMRFLLGIILSGVFIYAFQIYEYIVGHNSLTTIYEDEYINPKEQKFAFPNIKRNLIILYLESIESDYQNSASEPNNLLPHLSLLAAENYSFSGYFQLLYTNATIPSLAAGICGLPYKTELTLNNIYNLQNSILPGAMCYPELLVQNGYNTEFLQGSSLDFANTRRFVNHHGFATAEGFSEITARYQNKYPQITGNDWGIRDRILYKIAKEKLKNLAQKASPFMMMITTIDTHEPTTFLDPQCSSQYGDKRDVILCADSMAAEFIEWVQKQDFYQNTTIVVIGDHIVSGKNSIYPHHNGRGIFNMVINPVRGLKAQKHQWSTFDIAPTVLEAIGIDAPLFGLGRSLWQKTPTLQEKYALKLDFEFNKNSELYQKLQQTTQTTPQVTETYVLGKNVAETENISRYTPVYEINMDAVWADSLEMTLSQLPKNEICLRLDFIQMFETSTANSEIEITANSHPVGKWITSSSEKAPFERTICIPQKIINNDYRLVIKFQRNNKNNNFYFMTIGIKNFSIF